MDIEIEELAEQPVVGTRFRTSMDRIAEDMGRGFATVFGFLGQNQVAPTGPPFALYFDPEMNEQDIDMELCAPVGAGVDAEGELMYHVLPAGKYATTMHSGPYDQMTSTYEKMLEWMGENGFEPVAPVREVYLNDPGQVSDPSEIMTRIVWPVRPK